MDKSIPCTNLRLTPDGYFIEVYFFLNIRIRNHPRIRIGIYHNVCIALYLLCPPIVLYGCES